MKKVVVVAPLIIWCYGNNTNSKVSGEKQCQVIEKDVVSKDLENRAKSLSGPQVLLMFENLCA